MEALINKLVGEKIASLDVSGGETYLRFTTESGQQIVFEAYGDCCSESWFADIVGVEALLGGTVRETEVLDPELPDPPDGRCRQEFDDIYGFKLTTDKGYCDVIFRNSSNGYYGGWLTEAAPKDVARLTWKSIREDFKA